jgi:hypothetical protein
MFTTPRHHRITETCNHSCAVPRCARTGKCFSRVLLGPRCSTVCNTYNSELQTCERIRIHEDRVDDDETDSEADGDLGTLVGYNPSQPKNANWYALAPHWELPTYSGWSLIFRGAERPQLSSSEILNPSRA